LSENENGGFNLAPFSYFNAVSSDPPLLMLSVGKKPDGSPKDTRVNIEQRSRFVIHIAHRELVDPLGRLGPDRYVTFGETLHIPRPN
jgi:flavin reductase (DIM6/NTAB) family NADH-FMN oxidoreductase RutF